MDMAAVFLVGAVSLIGLYWMMIRYCRSFDRPAANKPEHQESRVFCYSRKHADSLVLQSRRHPKKPCASHVAKLEDGTLRRYTMSCETAAGPRLYKKIFKDAVELGKGIDVGPMGWWE